MWTTGVQLAALLIEKTTEKLSEENAEHLVRPTRCGMDDYAWVGTKG